MTDEDYIEELLHKAEKYGLRNKLIEEVQRNLAINFNSNRLDLYEHYFVIFEKGFLSKNNINKKAIG
ncbi:hypothetical protein [Winogradskyella sp.]|uniref:hypothetical protein n=1 Tax=Winogradskyella sp. TaxID=1883156 RepID=UPI003517851A